MVRQLAGHFCRRLGDGQEGGCAQNAKLAEHDGLVSVWSLYCGCVGAGVNPDVPKDGWKIVEGGHERGTR
jgi:hypothetical protein